MKNKKDEHVKLAQELRSSSKESDFDRVKFVHNPLPQMGLDRVDISSTIMGLKMEQPFFINAMTGGSDETRDINRKLAELARETGLLMASGSLSVALKDEGLADSFRVIRNENREGLVLANLGAEHSVENAHRAMDILGADGLQIHLNSLQELIMPGGDRDFSNWLLSLEKLSQEFNPSFMVKEVGFGMSRESIGLLKSIGVKTIDLGGYGGTNFAKIENFRRQEGDYDYMERFGQSTVISLLEAKDYVDDLEIIATGGVRNPLDIVKCLAMGARAVGLAGEILNMVLTLGVEKSILEIEKWKHEIRMIMTLLGARNIMELRNRDIIFTGEVRDWAIDRNIDYRSYGNRHK